MILTLKNMAITQQALADYCKGRIDRPKAERLLALASITPEGAKEILDAADRNLTIKEKS